MFSKKLLTYFLAGQEAFREKKKKAFFSLKHTTTTYSMLVKMVKCIH